MRISINLATRPFVEIRPLLTRLRVLMGLLAITAVALGVWLHSLNARAAVAQAHMNELKAQTARLQGERQANEARMRRPENRSVLERSQFLNDVFARKSFSWTAVMMDLERVLPSGVQVTSIEPQVASDGTVTIRLRVSGERDRSVQLVRNLENSARFVHPRLAGESAQATEGNGVGARGGSGALQPASLALPSTVEFEILSGYNPLSEVRRPAAHATPTRRKSGTGSPR
jgi:type IV pilus assembly protein PilN